MPDFLAEVLTWNNNYYNAVAVETAVGMGLRPTAFINDGDPRGEWSREDKKLAMAFTIMQRETCQKCGQPLWICRSDNKNLQFKAQKGVCYVTAELEKAAESRANKNLKKGQYLFAVPYMFDESPLPSRREYLESLNED